MNPSTLNATTMHLGDVPNGRALRLEAMDVDDGVRASLDAMGLAIGDVAVVLRRAAFGGPLHVRTSCGAEFAVCRTVASSIRGTLVREDVVDSAGERVLAVGSILEPSD